VYTWRRSGVTEKTAARTSFKGGERGGGDLKPVDLSELRQRYGKKGGTGSPGGGQGSAVKQPIEQEPGGTSQARNRPVAPEPSKGVPKESAPTETEAHESARMHPREPIGPEEEGAPRSRSRGPLITGPTAAELSSHPAVIGSIASLGANVV